MDGSCDRWQCLPGRSGAASRKRFRVAKLHSNMFHLRTEIFLTRGGRVRWSLLAVLAHLESRQHLKSYRIGFATGERHHSKSLLYMIRPVSRCSWSSGTLLRILGDVWLHLLPTTWVRTTLVKLHSSHHRMQLNRRVAQQFQAVLLDYWVSDSATESSIVREASCFDSVCGTIFLTESPPRNLDKWAILAHYRILDHPWLHLRHLCALGHWSFLYFGLTRLPQSFARLFLVNEGFWIQHTWQKYASARTMMRARQQRYLTKIEMLSSNSYGRDCIWSDDMNQCETGRNIIYCCGILRNLYNWASIAMLMVPGWDISSCPHLLVVANQHVTTRFEAQIPKSPYEKSAFSIFEQVVPQVLTCLGHDSLWDSGKSDFRVSV